MQAPYQLLPYCMSTNSNVWGYFFFEMMRIDEKGRGGSSIFYDEIINGRSLIALTIEITPF